MLTNFFQKYPVHHSEKDAIKVMHKTIECAEEKLTENPNDVTYLAELVQVVTMINDFFIEMNINPANVV